MAVTESNYTVSNSSTTNYSFTFPYLKTTDVKLSINGVASSAFTFANATTIQLNSNPTVGDKLRIYRETDDSKLEAEFFAGSAIKSSDLNDNFNQNLYVTQESNNKIDAAWTSGDETIDSTETWASNNTRVATTGAIDGRVDSKIDTALTTDVVGGQSITITDNSPGSGQITASVTAGSIRGTELAGDAVDGTKIADDSIDSEHYVAGSIDLEHMSANSVDSDQYVDGSIDSAHMSANSVATGAIVDGAVTNVKLANSSISLGGVSISLGATDATPSFNLQDATGYETSNLNGTITTAQVADANITTAKIADSSVTTSKIATSAVGTSRLNTGAVTTDKLAADAVDSSKLADNSIDSEHYVDGSIDTAHLGDLQVTTAKIAADAIDGTKLSDNAVSAEHIAANAVGDSEISTGALDNRYYTETELNAGQLDNRYYTETESDARYFNISTGDTIKDGDTFPDNDTTIATTAAINDRIIDLVDDVGGFVPIANETSFPNANPDVNNGTGTIVSIGSLAANHTSNGSGVITIANGTVGNSTVTINGADNSTTYSAGYGMLVETTSTLNTYTFHRLSSKATEVTTVASNITNINTVGNNNTNINTVAGANSNITTVAGSISNVNTTAGSIANVNTVATNINSVNDFSDVYRIASSAPTSHLHEGDLYFDTTSNELKVYNGSAWQGGVTATGNLAGLGANTFTGSQSLGDNNKVIFGTGGDLEIYFDGSNSYIKEPASVAGQLILQGWNGTDIRQGATGEHMIRAIGAGQVELYYDNAKKFETTSTGTNITGVHVDDGATHDGDVSFNGASYNSWWDKSDSSFKFDDNAKIKVGTGDDLQIFHDPSTANWIKSYTSNTLKIETNGNTEIITNNGDACGKFIKNGAVELYYDNAKKLETTSDGVKLTGHSIPATNNTYDLGSNSHRFRNLNIATDVDISDNGKLLLGNDDDLQIYHDGTNSIIDNNTGQLRIQGDLVRLMNSAGSKVSLEANVDGNVELYYDNVKKFETTSGGVLTTGILESTYEIRGDDNVKFLAGNSNDLEIYHDGTTNRIDAVSGNLHIKGSNLSLKSYANETYLDATADGAVELYYDGVKKFETLSAGCRVSSGSLYILDNSEVNIGNGNDLKLYHNTTDSFIVNTSNWLNLNSDKIYLGNAANNEAYLKALANGAVELYYDNSKKLETRSDGVGITGILNMTSHIYLGDSDTLICGAGNDLEIYHNGTNSYVKNNHASSFYIQSNGNLLLEHTNGDNYFKGVADGAAELYYDNSKKLETYSGGVSIHGLVSASSGSFVDNGTAHPGPVLNVSGDDSNVWFGRIGNETYHDSVASGFKFYVNDSGNALFYHTGNAEYRDWVIGSYNGTTYKTDIYKQASTNTVGLYYDGNLRINTSSLGVYVSGTVTDTKGELRTIVQNTQSGAYTLVAADAGKHILASGNITVPDSVFSAGQAITIVNNTAGNLTITKGTNMYNTADGTNANRTLATRGMATLLFTAADTAYISGAGLS